MKIDPLKEMCVEGIALQQTVLPKGLEVTSDTIVTLAPGAKLTYHGQPIGEIIEIQHKNGAWHYTAKITDPAAFRKISQNQ